MKRVAAVVLVAAASSTLPASAAPLGSGKIAFSTPSGIRVVNTDGRALASISSEHPESGPDWSPDGSRLAFSVGRDTAERIVVTGADGSGRRVVAARGASNPVWSPDGERIAFARDGAVYIVRSDGSAERRLTGGLAVAWAPDGSRLAVSSGGDLRVIDADGRNERPLDVPRGAAPAWSPDGARIAFLAVEGLDYLGFCCGGSVHVVNADGTGLTRVSPKLNYPSAPEWSPDGRSLLVNSWDIGLLAAIPHPAGPGRIEVYGAVSGVRTAALPGRAPRWSPDAGRIVFVRRSGRADVTDVYVANADGTCTTQVTDRGDASSPAWQPQIPDPSRLHCADLSIGPAAVAETTLSPPSVHDAIRIRLRIANSDGNLSASGVKVRVDLPARLLTPRVSIAGRRCAVSRGAARCSLPRLAVGAGAEVLVSGRPARADRYSFSAAVRAKERDGDRFDNRTSLAVEALRCTRDGTARRDVLLGSAARDRLCGLAGDDVLRGLPRGDLLIGHAGDDVLDGGPGLDTMWGGAGGDGLLARDGERDLVICGAGADRVVADPVDIVAADCENVTRRDP